MDPNRKEEIAAIIDCLNNYQPFAEASEQDKDNIAKKIEKGIYEYAIEKARERHIQASLMDDEFVIIYSNISYNIKVNLDIQSSINADHKEDVKTYLVSRLYDGTIAPEIIGSANAITLNPLINQVYLDEIALRQQQGINMKYSKMYKCGKCYKSKARVREIQSASSDEGTTLFINCINCGHRWRQYS